MDAIEPPDNKFSRAIETTILKIGRCCSFLNMILIVVILFRVIMRYIFGIGLVQLEELEWHLYAVNVIFGLAYCHAEDSHIRLDLVHDKLNQRTKEIIEILGILFLVMPLIIVIFIHGVDFWWEAVRTNERSDNLDSGLPYRWIPKSLIPLSMIAFFASALARLVRGVHYLSVTKKGG